MKKLKNKAGRRACRVLAAGEYLVMILLVFSISYLITGAAAAFDDPRNGVIVIDPGHGGVDGGTVRGSLLEKDVNLKLALKLKTQLEQRGYTVILTRDRDISLDRLNQASNSRQRRDLIARAGLINGSTAQLFLSLHVNSIEGDPSENGSIVFYGTRFLQSKTLALCLQEKLNAITVNGKSRQSHEPLRGKYYLLTSTGIPGVIVETAFISNAGERELLKTEIFLDRLAAAIASGTVQYLQSE